MRWAPLARIASRAALPLWLPRLSRMTISPGARVGANTFSTYSVNSSPLMGLSMTQGALIRSWRSAAMKVMVFQWPKGAAAMRRWPLGPQPRNGAMLVLIHVSSIKTRLHQRDLITHGGFTHKTKHYNRQRRIAREA